MKQLLKVKKILNQEYLKSFNVLVKEIKSLALKCGVKLIMSKELSDLFKEKSISDSQNFNSIKITLSKS